MFIMKEEDSDEEDSVPVSKAEARVDMVLRSSRDGDKLYWCYNISDQVHFENPTG